MNPAARSNPEPDFPPTYRPDIDGLRAVAILAVIAFHAFPSRMRGGYVGVDVFFVISGFLISSIIFRDLHRGSFSFAAFYARRIKRIFPALILILSAALVFGWVALLPDEFKQLGKHIAASAGFVQNFVLWREAGYFDTESEVKPLLHLWSLAIEEQFYLIYPLIVWGLWRLRLNVVAVILAIASVSFAVNVAGVGKDAVGTFFAPHTRFWELMAGSALAYTYLFDSVAVANWLSPGVIHPAVFRPASDADRRHALNTLLAAAGLLLLVLSLFGISRGRAFPGWWALAPVAGAFFVIMAGPGAWVNRTILANKAMVFVGLISYPLYLWHWLILSLARIVESGIPPPAFRLAAIAVSFLLAWLTYQLVERPIRFGKKSRVRTIALAAAMVIVGVTGYTVFARDGFAARQNIREAALIHAQFSGPVWNYMNNDVCLARYPLPGSEKFDWWFCMASKPAPPDILLLGTSHANHLYPGFAMDADFSRSSILSIGTCDVEWIDADDIKDTSEDRNPCSGFRLLRQFELINGIIAAKTLKLVVVSGVSREPSDDYVQRLKRRIDFIERSGAKAIVFIPHAPLGYDPKGCFRRPFKAPVNDCVIAASEYESILKRYKEIADVFAKTNPEVKFFDQNKVFCNGTKCSAIVDGLPLYRDLYSHYSEYASRKVVEGFKEWMKSEDGALLSKLTGKDQ